MIYDFQAVAFDFDGTLVDTLHFHYEAYRVVFKQMNLELDPETFYSNIGGKATEAIPLFIGDRKANLEISEIHTRKKDIIKGMFATEPIRVLPAFGLVSIFSGKLPLALVSSGSRSGILQILKRLGWSDMFDVIVTGEDTDTSKPDPAPYLLASRKLGIAPENMVAFEDTLAGIASAKNAGYSVFDVSHNNNNYLI